MPTSFGTINAHLIGFVSYGIRWSQHEESNFSGLCRLSFMLQQTQFPTMSKRQENGNVNLVVPTDDAYTNTGKEVLSNRHRQIIFLVAVT